MALQEIRVANTHPTGIELLQRQNEKKVKAALRMLDKKRTSRPGSSTSKRRKRKEENGNKADEDKKLELLISAPPTRRLQTLQDMRKAAGKLYHFARMEKKASAGRVVGVPRTIFPEIVEDIRRMHDEQLLDQPMASVRVEYAQPRNDGAVKLRPLSARAAIKTASGEGEEENEADEGDKEAAQRRPRSANAALRRNQAMQRKEEIFREREAVLLERICTREGAHAARYERLQRAARQRAFLVLFALLGVGRHAQRALRAHQRRLQAEVAPAVKSRNALLVPWAARAICRWWRRAVVVKKIRSNSRVFQIIVAGVMRLKNSFSLRKKRAAAAVLRRFFIDVTSLGDIKKVQIRIFCRKILRLQKHVRAYLKIQDCRLMLVHAAAEKIREQRQRQRLIKAARDERLSLMAMSATAGFAKVMTSLPILQAKIRSVLVIHEANERRLLLARMQSAEDEAAAPAAGPGHVRRGGVSGHAHKQDSDSKARQWVRNMQADPRTAARLQAFKAILKSQRRRHVLTIDQSRQRLKTAKREVNEGALREFLRRPDVHDGLDRVFDIVGTDGTKIKNSDASAAVLRFPPFLLLAGALPYLEHMPDSFFE